MLPFLPALTLFILTLALAMGGVPSSGYGADSHLLAGHQAQYHLRTSKLRRDGEIRNVSGNLYVDYIAACTGWDSVSDFTLQIIYRDSDDVFAYHSAERFFEHYDASLFRFSSQEMVNGQEINRMRGEARRRAHSGADYLLQVTEPEEHEEALPSGIVFPMGQLALILERLTADETLMSMEVFTGNLDNGLLLYNVVVGRFLSRSDIEQRLADYPGAAGDVAADGYRLHLAAYKKGTTEPEPEFEMTLTLLENGIMLDFEIDYRDYSLQATPETLRLNPPAEDCDP